MYGTAERRMSRSKPPPPPINTSLASRQYLSAQQAGGGKDPRSGSKSATSFVTPTDLQSSAAAAAVAAASAANAASDTYSINSVSMTANSSAASAAAAANAARTKKSLPFLMKNPVSSLLGRRKTPGSGSDLAGLPPANADAPVYAPIRGTRVHDFSAPRPRRVMHSEQPTAASTAAAAAAAAIANASGMAATKPPVPTFSSSTPFPPTVSRQGATTSANLTTPMNTMHTLQQTPSHPSSEVAHVAQGGQSRPVDDSEPLSQSPARQSSSSAYTASRQSSVTREAAAQPYVAPFQNPAVTDLRPGPPMRMPSQNNSLQTLQENRAISFDEKPLPDRPAVEDSPRTSDVAERPASSVTTASTPMRSHAALADVASLLKSSPSTGTTRSRNMSLTDLSPNANPTPGGGVPSTSATTPASVVSAASVLPKHMKSTSSRFSFMIGSASQEKLLEERHRQKQAEKKTRNVDGDSDSDTDGMGTRDSRFDDFDEDGFDYDAMMDDEGLEERIPGVNADFDDIGNDDAHLFGNDDVEEEIPYVGGDDDVSETVHAVNLNSLDSLDNDNEPEMQLEAEDDDPEGLNPDNDQENFAGFVFQRSTPVSSLVSPTSAGLTVSTPRDASGRVIGFAVSKDMTPDLHPPSTASLSPLDGPSAADAMFNLKMAGYSSALVHGMEDDSREDMSKYEGEEDDETDTAQTTVTVSQAQGVIPGPMPGPMPMLEPAHQGHTVDDLYFDQGLADELDFGDADTSGVPFDESLFDLNDTDQYGRPIPGAFAAAQAQRAAMVAAIEAAAASGSLKRESDVPSSQMSEKSPLTESTAHTSMSAFGMPYGGGMSALEKMPDAPSAIDPNSLTSFPVPVLSSQFAAPPSSSQARKHESSLTALRRQLPPIMTDAERVAAYQASLAEAAYKAAALGKFRRDSSPPPFSPAPTSSPPGGNAGDAPGSGTGLGLSLGPGDADESTIDDSSALEAHPRNASDDHETQMASHLAYAFTSQRDLDYHYDLEDNDEYAQDMDDYDFDDAIIAEANAEALANDMDGFYGQEFNFYSAHHHGSGSDLSSSSKDGAQFANGGYFIPTDALGRSTSGRVVSREPNLTPITERSEYSNRNSVLSLAVPPIGGSGGELRSPGLMQLARLADDDGSDMSMSALMRLRSRAFGGAGGSQASLSSSREGSPMLVAGQMSSSPLGNASSSDRGDRDNASSPFSGLTYAQLQLLQKQYPLPAPQPFYRHHRINSNNSFSSLSRGVGGGGGGPAGAINSDLNSEAGSESVSASSPTMMSLPVAQALPPLSPVPTQVQVQVTASMSSCPPVMEEEDGEGGDVSAPVSASGAGTGLWMRSPVRESSAADKKVRRHSASGWISPPLSPGGPPPPIPPLSSRRSGKRGHRHRGSADSISYVKEEDSGESRWVMERRRLADSGEVELLEREVVKGI